MAESIFHIMSRECIALACNRLLWPSQFWHFHCQLDWFIIHVAKFSFSTPILGHVPSLRTPDQHSGSNCKSKPAKKTPRIALSGGYARLYSGKATIAATEELPWGYVCSKNEKHRSTSAAMAQPWRRQLWLYGNQAYQKDLDERKSNQGQ